MTPCSSARSSSAFLWQHTWLRMVYIWLDEENMNKVAFQLAQNYVSCKISLSIQSETSVLSVKDVRLSLAELFCLHCVVSLHIIMWQWPVCLPVTTVATKSKCGYLLEILACVYSLMENKEEIILFPRVYLW